MVAKTYDKRHRRGLRFAPSELAIVFVRIHKRISGRKNFRRFVAVVKAESADAAAVYFESTPVKIHPQFGGILAVNAYVAAGAHEQNATSADVVFDGYRGFKGNVAIREAFAVEVEGYAFCNLVADDRQPKIVQNGHYVAVGKAEDGGVEIVEIKDVGTAFHLKVHFFAAIFAVRVFINACVRARYYFNLDVFRHGGKLDKRGRIRIEIGIAVRQKRAIVLLRSVLEKNFVNLGAYVENLLRFEHVQSVDFGGVENFERCIFRNVEAADKARPHRNFGGSAFYIRRNVNFKHRGRIHFEQSIVKKRQFGSAAGRAEGTANRAQSRTHYGDGAADKKRTDARACVGNGESRTDD